MHIQDMERSPDWQCPNPACVNHTALVFGSKAFCPKCGTPKAGLQTALKAAGQEQVLPRVTPVVTPSPRPSSMFPGSAFELMGMGRRGGASEGDWQCPNVECINHTKYVFGKHASCPSCGQPRNPKTVGDWLCPNPSCVNSRNSVFGKHQSCPKCGMSRPTTYGGAKPTASTPKPVTPAADTGTTSSSSMMRYLQGSMGYGSEGFGSEGYGSQGYASQGYASKGYGLNDYMAAALTSTLMASLGRPGDWQCPNMECVNNKRMVFAKHETCPLCGTAKPGKGGSNPQDWQCPNAECVNHRNLVFAKHATCPRCGQPRDTARQRSRSPR